MCGIRLEIRHVFRFFLNFNKDGHKAFFLNSPVYKHVFMLLLGFMKFEEY